MYSVQFHVGAVYVAIHIIREFEVSGGHDRGGQRLQGCSAQVPWRFAQVIYSTTLSVRKGVADHANTLT